MHPAAERNSYELVIRPKRQAKVAPQPVADTTLRSATQQAASDGQLAAAEACSGIPTTSVQCLPPQLAAVLLLAPESMNMLGLRLQCTADRLVMVFADSGHWACLGFHIVTPGTAAVLYLDGVHLRLYQPALRLAQAVAAAFGLHIKSFEPFTWYEQEAPHECGRIALQHAVAFVTSDLQRAPEWADQLLLKHQHCPAQVHASGQLSADQNQRLQDLLVERGVPKPAVENRVAAALQKIGAGPIAKALAMKNAWPQLKSLGSQPNCMFRWIQHDELTAHIDERAHAKFGTAVPNSKEKKRKDKAPKAAAQPLQVDPTKLQIAPGSFTTVDGRPLPQLAFSEVGAEVQGVAFCSPQQAVPFLQNPQSLSVDALALVCVTELPPDVYGGATVSSLQFPAVYSPTEEAILIRGSLIQIGDEVVQLASQSIAEVQQLETVTCRISVYRDEIALDWSELQKGPIRVLLQLIPALSLCADKACAQTCGRFHPAVEEVDVVDRLIIDLWGRQWSKLEGGRASPNDAQSFHCLIRVPSSALLHLQQIMVRGFYTEPRATGGAGPHPGFAVNWLPDADYAKALHTLHTCTKAIAIARLSKRYGVRVREQDEQAVFEAVRPGSIFTKVAVKAHYRLHPLPFGCLRKHLIALLREWKWEAKPLQPARGDAEGAAWIVGASDAPPSPALACGDAYVLVRKVRDTAAAAAQPLVTASGRTKRSILYDDDDNVADPWANGLDPWALSRAPPGLPAPTTGSTPASGSTAATKLSQLRTEITSGVQEIVKKQVSETVKAADAHANAAETRLTQLEATVNELKHQGTKFEGWFQSFGQQVSAVQQTVAAQQADLAQVKNEVAQHSESLQQTVQTAVGTIATDIAAQLQQQFNEQSNRLEALLTKKHRAE